MRARLVLILTVWAIASAAFAARPTPLEDDHLKEATLVYAILAGGKRVVSHDVHVYTPQSNPFVGLWRQTAEWDRFSGLPPGNAGAGVAAVAADQGADFLGRRNLQRHLGGAKLP